MTMYWVGDLQGCNASFGRLLDVLGFTPSRDRLVLLGDLINRGPDNAGVLQRLLSMGDSAQCLLGNHDLYVLAAFHGYVSLKSKDSARHLLGDARATQWMEWLATRKLALYQNGCLLVHAGVLPHWDVPLTLQLAGEVERALSDPERLELLQQMVCHQSPSSHAVQSRPERWRESINALTRLRFCTPEGVMEFASKGKPDPPPLGHLPWFDVPGRASADTPVVFGHWAALGGLCRPNLACLDTGCVWGRRLSALRVPDRVDQNTVPDLSQWEWISVAADPGDVFDGD